jgi:hypothetical protein
VACGRKGSYLMVDWKQRAYERERERQRERESERERRV